MYMLVRVHSITIANNNTKRGLDVDEEEARRRERVSERHDGIKQLGNSVILRLVTVFHMNWRFGWKAREDKKERNKFNVTRSCK